jgi:diguanylate cyclase (GGDEF)-like protein
MPMEKAIITDVTNKLLARPRLLIVDDQPINIQTLYQVFSADHQVFMATGGAQALVLCESKLPDLVLLDVEMPDMDGYEVCSRLKANPLTRDIPVIFITGHSDEAAETHGLDVGAVDFISKPINPKIVRARVKNHLTLKAQSDLLRDWVYIDGLTGVKNRRYFDEHINAEWGRALRNNSLLSVIMLDVDFFKRYNDCYGHLSGDDCLRQVANVFKRRIHRSMDFVARYGGEEFVCLLPDSNFEGAMQLAEQLRQDVFALQIPHAESLLAPFVTVSLGVSTKQENMGGTSDALLMLADAQLYQAKEQGRNRVCGQLLS